MVWSPVEKKKNKEKNLTIVVGKSEIRLPRHEDNYHSLF